MASKKRSTSAKDPLQVHTTLEFRRDKGPGLIVRHGGGGELRYLEFELPDKRRSVRVEWNSNDYGGARRGNRSVPVQLTVDNDRPRPLTYKNGAFYEKDGSAPFVDKKAAVIGERFVEVFAEAGAPDRVTRAQRPSGAVVPYGWFSCMADTAGAGAGLGAAVGGVAGAPGGVAGAGAGAATGAGLGAAAGAIFGIGFCTTSVILGIA